ncbi:MAG: D-aminoacyl-tRNA deacylase [Granulosicoccus sp.]
MIALIQRVTEASVTVGDERIASIGAGMLAFIGVEATDSERSAEQLAQRILGYRIFGDEQGRMNLDLIASGGQLLLVPQFTLVADTRKGRRPGFSSAASPEQAALLFDYLANHLKPQIERLGLGRFGADMQVALVNDGPVTFWLKAEP